MPEVADTMSGGWRSFAHSWKTPMNTNRVGWLRGDLLVGGVDIRLRFWPGLLGVESGLGEDGYLRSTHGWRCPWTGARGHGYRERRSGTPVLVR